ncbi:uncharacterized protein RB166_015416 isoform 2-T2 [Leptodactylus fuscus]|uniref:uncharacterized protein LOC142185219 isoform X2 n=1 Tax=Leptodactylus fuscus TaxID=238119 RepID=UPI003F4F2CCC
MNTVYESRADPDRVTMADIQWFYSKSKVPICLAITDILHFLNKLHNDGILTEEESLELQGDTRTVHRVVYECLCCLEEKDLSIEHFFEVLFQKSFLKKYPDLKPIHAEYKEGKYRNGIHSTTDKDKDPMIFAQEKVRICLTIKDRFPFLHGLQDLTILSESESLKLQADERPVSRVIYESLSLIEKKDMKLNIVFEYIFQECYLKLYPGLQDILQEPSGEFVAPFNGGQYPMFNITSDLLEFFEHSKTYICEAVNERFPFLHGLHDFGLLSYIQLLKLQADERSTKEVLYEALCHIKTLNSIETFFAYVFQEFYLKLYPALHISFQCLNTALTLDICPRASCTEKLTEAQDPNTPIAVIVKDEMMDVAEQSSSTPYTVLYENEARQIEDQDSSKLSTVILKGEIIEIPDQDSSEDSPVIQRDTNIEIPKPDCNEPSAVLYESEAREFHEQDIKETLSDSDTVLPPLIRRCRMQPISYSEPPDLVLEANNEEEKDKEKLHRRKSGKREAQETPICARRNGRLNIRETTDPGQGKLKCRKYRKREAKETLICARRNGSLGVKEKIEPGLVTKPVSVKLEFPKQVFNDKFKVRCGDKIGIFKKSRWTGDSSKDLCIRCEGRKFSVTRFEIYGGRGASKNWKKTIQCEEIKLECLIKAGILKPAIWPPNRRKRKYRFSSEKTLQVYSLTLAT